jgi:hypothetical protein
MDRVSSLAVISFTALVASGALALGACGNGDNQPDAPPDTPPGPCGAEMFFTGELVDWDSTDANFCGVFNSRLTRRGAQSPSDMTAPNGRFELCVPREAQLLVDVMHSTTASGCVGVTGSYPVRAVLVAQQAVVDRGAAFSARAMTELRQTGMFTQVGEAYNAARAQLVVHVVGTPRAVSISSTHATAQRYDGAAWAAGDTGREVFFPNVDPGPTQITVAGGAVGTGMVTLEADAFTYVTVATN